MDGFKMERKPAREYLSQGVSQTDYEEDIQRLLCGQNQKQNNSEQVKPQESTTPTINKIINDMMKEL